MSKKLLKKLAKYGAWAWLVPRTGCNVWQLE